MHYIKIIKALNKRGKNVPPIPNKTEARKQWFLSGVQIPIVGIVWCDGNKYLEAVQAEDGKVSITSNEVERETSISAK